MYLIVNNFGELVGLSKTYSRCKNRRFHVMGEPFVEKREYKQVDIVHGVLEIPSTITRIANGAFECHEVRAKKIVLPNTIKEIESYAFVDLYDTEIVVNSDVKHIGLCAFLGCKAVTFNTPISNPIEESAFAGTGSVTGKYTTKRYRDEYAKYKELLTKYDFDAYAEEMKVYYPILDNEEKFNEQFQMDLDYYDSITTDKDSYVFNYTALAYIKEIHEDIIGLK